MGSQGGALFGSLSISVIFYRPTIPPLFDNRWLQSKNNKQDRRVSFFFFFFIKLKLNFLNFFNDQKVVSKKDSEIRIFFKYAGIFNEIASD